MNKLYKIGEINAEYVVAYEDGTGVHHSDYLHHGDIETIKANPYILADWETDQTLETMPDNWEIVHPYTLDYIAE